MTSLRGWFGAVARSLARRIGRTDARRDARVSPDGKLVLLDDQDRSLWDAAEIEQGRAALERGLALRMPGPYQLQAAIASLHTEAETDWSEVALLYAGWRR